MREKEIFREFCPIIHKAFPTPDSCLLTLSSAMISPVLQPGQFINIMPPGEGGSRKNNSGIREGWLPGDGTGNPRHYALLRRPLSMHQVHRSERTGQVDSFSVLFRIIGKGTRLIADKEPGDVLDVLGPLGHPFPDPPEGRDVAYFIAGGFGIAPLIPMAEKVHQAGMTTAVFWGVESFDIMPLECSDCDEVESGAVNDTNDAREVNDASVAGNHLVIERLKRQGIPSYIAVRSGQFTTREKNVFSGTVVDLFEHFRKRNTDHETLCPIIYTCGPEAMMRTVTEYATAKGWPCRVSLEKFMACGIGACMSCVCKLAAFGDGPGFSYRRTCTDGPSFWGEHVLWQEK